MAGIESLKCPICSNTLSPPILQCKGSHSMCGKCIVIKAIKTCPTCDKPISKRRNLILEKTIEELNAHIEHPCLYKPNGCRSKLTMATKSAHENECKHKTRCCEGRTFCGWKCNWSGSFKDTLEHFITAHKPISLYGWKEDAINLKISFADHVHIRIISFRDGSELFYYKHKVDARKQKAFWTFQYVGPEEEAKKYVYEFEIRDGPVRKLKIEEYCKSNSIDANQIFESEECVAVSFTTIKTFLSKSNYLTFKYRIMKKVSSTATDKKR